MLDITGLVMCWAECSSDIWERWFKQMDDGNHEFLALEEFLLKIIVLEKLPNPKISPSTFFKSLEIIFLKEIKEKRSVFIEQKSGTIFGKSEVLNIEKGTSYKIKSIDPKGLMLDEKPYAEVIFEERFFLEPLNNISTPLHFKFYYDEQIFHNKT